jgi:hypothetical protein
VEAAGLVWKLRGQRPISTPAVTPGAANPSLTSAYAAEGRLEVPD